MQPPEKLCCYATKCKWSYEHVAYGHTMTAILFNKLHKITLWMWCYQTCCISWQFEARWRGMQLLLERLMMQLMMQLITILMWCYATCCNWSVYECDVMQHVATDQNMNVILCYMLQLITIWVWYYETCCNWSQYESELMQHVAPDDNMYVILCNMLHKITLWVPSNSTRCITSNYECDVTQHVA